MNCTKEKINDEIKSYKHRGKVNRNQIAEKVLTQHNGSSSAFLATKASRQIVHEKKHESLTNDWIYNVEKAAKMASSCIATLDKTAKIHGYVQQFEHLPHLRITLATEKQYTTLKKIKKENRILHVDATGMNI